MSACFKTATICSTETRFRFTANVPSSTPRSCRKLTLNVHQKIGELIRISVRRVWAALADGYPQHRVVPTGLRAVARRCAAERGRERFSPGALRTQAGRSVLAPSETPSRGPPKSPRPLPRTAPSPSHRHSHQPHRPSTRGNRSRPPLHISAEKSGPDGVKTAGTKPRTC